MDSKWLCEAEAVFERIRRAQEEAIRGFSPDVSGVRDSSRGRDHGVVRTSRRGRGPLLAPQDVRIDSDRFERLLADILGIVEEWTGESVTVDGGELRLSGLAGDIPGEAMAASLAGGGALEERAAGLGVRPEPFACSVRYALAPFLKAYADELRSSLDLESFHSGPGRPDSVVDPTGCCPVCGAEPFMAELDAEDGRRYLACGLCGTRWRFPRLECPFCGNTDQGSQGFLEVEGLPHLTAGYRIDVCEACRRYVKTLDRRKLREPITLELADVLTPELDEVATERGYLVTGAFA